MLAHNAHLAWTLHDAARTIELLRDEGERLRLRRRSAPHPLCRVAYAKLLDEPLAEGTAAINNLFGPVSGRLWKGVTGDEVQLCWVRPACKWSRRFSRFSTGNQRIIDNEIFCRLPDIKRAYSTAWGGMWPVTVA